MNSQLTAHDPTAIFIILGFALAIGLAWLLSYTRPGKARPALWGARQARAPRPPVAPLDPALPVRTAVLKLRASRAQRIETFLCDVVFLALVIIGGLLLAGWALHLMAAANPPPGAFGGAKQLLGATSHGHGGLPVAILCAIALFIFLYYAVLEAKFGRTVGKLVAGTRVVDLDGCPITLGQAMGRTLCRRLPYESVSLLFPDDKHGGRSAWHDAIPGTVVINTRAEGKQA